MKVEDYQELAHSFASYGENPTYAYAGLAEEAGEVLGKFAKFLRHNGGKAPWDYDADPGERERFKDALFAELGDVMWFVSELCTQNGFKLADVMVGNVDKLADRKVRGKIDGEGDNR